MKVKKINLLLIAGIVWMIAGFNILRIGIISYKSNISILNIIISLIIFSLFWFKIFNKLVNKHTARIAKFEDEFQKFYKFFDRPSFLIMIFMMSFGIGLRASNILPDKYIAIFYTGLGSALFLAGLSFLCEYFKEKKRKALNK